MVGRVIFLGNAMLISLTFGFVGFWLEGEGVVCFQRSGILTVGFCFVNLLKSFFFRVARVANVVLLPPQLFLTGKQYSTILFWVRDVRF